MIRHQYREEKSSLGTVIRPVAEVVLEKDDFKVAMPMYIDSGADISMIPLHFGRALGFKQEDDDIIQEIKGVSGAGIPYIIKNVNLIIDNKELEIRIAWALVEEVPMLMGRMDIFNKFRIIFDEKNGWIDFEE
ncbi:MAG: hypothetical protein KAJ51_12300 [Thermoplasmata archaeon]|nr:hypothetical protein [Thermoplasmata archaeon]